MSFFNGLLSSVKSRLSTADTAAADTESQTQGNEDLDVKAENLDKEESAQDLQPTADSNVPSQVNPGNQEELTEMQITQVIQTSEGKQEEVDPYKFKVYNTTRNQSLDIVISSQVISRSMTGVEGDDKS